MQWFSSVFYGVYHFLWGDLITIPIPLPGGSCIGLSLMVLMLIPTGIFFTVRTGFLPIRCFGEMLHVTLEKQSRQESGSLSGLQALIVSTATRVGMGNMAGVVAAVAAGGPGAVFWMWITALIGASTAFAEATLAQLYRQKDPLYGGYRGGPAYYLHAMFTRGRPVRHHWAAVLFALSGLLCWCGVSQVISNSVTSSLQGAFGIPPILSVTILVVLAAVVVLRKNTSVQVLDKMVPVMAAFYFALAVFVILKNAALLPGVLRSILEEAFGLRQMAAGGFGAALMNGVKRGLFSNEAGSGSAPCAAAAGNVSHPAKSGLFQAFGVLIDTIVICTCTAMIMLLAPAEVTAGLKDMTLLQAAMQHHFGYMGVVFTAVTLWLFCFSTFIGILYYARSNVAYLFGDNQAAQLAYKLLALAMLFIGGLATYTFVWDLGDIGIGLMTIFNLVALLPLSGQAIRSLEDYLARRKAGEQV